MRIAITLGVQSVVYIVTLWFCIRIIKRTGRICYLKGTVQGWRDATDRIDTWIDRANEVQWRWEANNGIPMTANDFRVIMSDIIGSDADDMKASVAEVGE